MLHEINLNNSPIQEYDAALLSALVAKYLLPDEGTGVPELIAGREYSLEFNGDILQIRLSHSIVKILKKNSPDFSLRILDGNVYHGPRSDIYLSTRKLILTPLETNIIQTPEMLVKRSLLDNDCDDISRLQNECALNWQFYDGRSRGPFFFKDTRYQLYAYCMMPKLPWPDLSDINKNTLNLITKLNIAIALIHAVDDFHKDTGQIHCDLKPENIKVDLSQNPPVVRLIDFGSAVKMRDAIAGAQLNGTPAYMIPKENLDRVPLQPNDVVVKFYFDEKVDSYSLAIILYELFSDIPKKHRRGVAAILNKMQDSGDLSFAITSFENFLVSQNSKFSHPCVIQ